MVSAAHGPFSEVQHTPLDWIRQRTSLSPPSLTTAGRLSLRSSMASYANGEASASSSRQPVLRARARDVRTVASLLRPIAFTSICQVTISEPGLQIVTELNGVLQATAYIGCGMFDEFVYAPEPRDVPDDDEEEGIAVSTFDVSLSTWLSCLNIYGTAAGNFSSASSSDKDAGRQGVLAREPDFRRAPFARGKTVVEMTYAGVGHPLTLEIKDEKVTSRCELATFETNTTVISDMPYLAERTVGQVIMHSKQLTEALMSIDTSSRHVTFAFIDDPSRGGFTAGNDDRPPRTPIRAPAGGSRTVHVPPSSEMDTSDAADLFDTRAAYRAHRGSEMMRISAVGDTGSTEVSFVFYAL